MTASPHKQAYCINGVKYSREDLLAHCHMVHHDCKNPDWLRKVFQFIEHFLVPASGPIYQSSSGTTGDPKRFELRREAMEASAIKTLWFFKLNPGERVLLALPVDYIAGKMMVVRALVGRLDLVLCEPSSRPLKSVEGSFRFVPMVPLQVHESIEGGDDLSRCGTLLIGGGELAASLREGLGALTSAEVFESFGMSETYTHFGLKRINGPNPDPCFRTLSGTKISTDSRGCLVVDLPGVTVGPVVTNDLVELCEGGDGFVWLGRYDNVINSGGIKVIPEILEERIGHLLGTTVLLLPQKDEKLGEKMVMLVEWEKSKNQESKEKLHELWKSKLEGKLSSHELPKKLISINKLPRNASSKPDRIAARALLL